MRAKNTAIKGVNLGGWLVAEKWITPSLFEDLPALDEYTLSLSAEGRSRLAEHRQTFIMADDFKWLASCGIEAVRLPVGYWALRPNEAYLGCQAEIEFAFSEAAKNNISVLIGLHGAPGSQNGRDHSGKIGPIEWNIEASLSAIAAITEQVSSFDNLMGISLLNEPDWDISNRILADYYSQAYRIIRRICGENPAVVISDSFRPRSWIDYFKNPSYENVWIDSHLYQLFTSEDNELSLNQHIAKVENDWANLINEVQASNNLIIGEWSGALNLLKEDNIPKRRAIARYVSAQLEVFSESKAWFFWTYKTEQHLAWNFRKLVEAGLIKI